MSSLELIVKEVAVPEPTAIEKVPESVLSAGTAVPDVVQVSVWANCVTVTEWLPATAEVDAEVSARTLGLELDPSIEARAPSKFVRANEALERFESAVPIVEKAASS